MPLGWEATADDWDAAIDRADARHRRTRWVVQERIPIRREPFPGRRARRTASSCATCSSTSRPTCSAAAQVGYLTRLSSSGLANVTSGGGQVASFVVRAR